MKKLKKLLIKGYNSELVRVELFVMAVMITCVTIVAHLAHLSIPGSIMGVIFSTVIRWLFTYR